MRKIQCKTSQVDGKCLRIPTRAVNYKGGKVCRHFYSKDDIDYFATLYKEEVLLIPRSEFKEDVSSISIRLYQDEDNPHYRTIESYKLKTVLEHEFGEFVEIESDFGWVAQTRNITRKKRMKQPKPSQKHPLIFQQCERCGKQLRLTIANKKKIRLCKDCFDKTRPKKTKQEVEEAFCLRNPTEISKALKMTYSSARRLARRFGILIEDRRKYNKISDATREAQNTPEAREKCRLGLQKATASSILTRARAVEHIDVEGNIIKKYPTIQSTIEDGFCPTQVRFVCNGKRKHHKHTLWRYAVSQRRYRQNGDSRLPFKEESAGSTPAAAANGGVDKIGKVA